MEFKELIQARRSVRAFQENTAITKELMEEIIAEAQQAPSWKNSQTARYYVVSSPEMITKVRELALPGFNQRSSANAPVLVVTSFLKDVAGFTAGQPDNELGNEWGAYDLGLANGFFVLSATSHGLDTLIMGLRDADALRTLLGIPVNEEISAVLAVGYRVKDSKMPSHREIGEIAKFF